MSAANLPSDILRKVFQTAALADLTAQTTPTIILHPPGSHPIPLLEYEFRLATHESIIRTALALSHVCAAWRETAVSFPELWRRVYLTNRTCTYDGLLPMTDEILSRSETLGLCLDIDFTDRPPFLAPQIARRDRENITGLISSYISRCRSLRVEGSHAAIKLALDVWLQHNTMVRICGVGNDTPLAQLHIVQSEYRPTTLDYTFFLNKIAPSVACLRSQRANIAGYPVEGDSWLRDIVLEDVYVSAAAYRQVVSLSRARNVILRRIDIAAISTTTKSVTIGISPSKTTSLKLEDIQCDGLAKARAYSEFFLSTVICSLHDLEFSDMETFRAWLAFVVVYTEVVPRHFAPFDRVRKLTLRKVTVRSRGGGENLFALTQTLPNLETLVMQDMTVAGDVLVEMWRWGTLGGKVIWPALNRVVVDGVLLERKKVYRGEGVSLVDYGMLHV